MSHKYGTVFRIDSRSACGSGPRFMVRRGYGGPPIFRWPGLRTGTFAASAATEAGLVPPGPTRRSVCRCHFPALKADPRLGSRDPESDGRPGRRARAASDSVILGSTSRRRALRTVRRLPRRRRHAPTCSRPSAKHPQSARSNQPSASSPRWRAPASEVAAPPSKAAITRRPSTWCPSARRPSTPENTNAPDMHCAGIGELRRTEITLCYKIIVLRSGSQCTSLGEVSGLIQKSLKSH